MTSDAFQVQEDKLRELIDAHLVSLAGSRQRAQAHEIVPELETLVVDQSDNPRLHEAGSAEQLAWYVYILATSGSLDMPRDVPPHGLGGYSVRGPECEEALIIQVYCEDGPRVNSGPLAPDDLSSRRGSGHQEAVEGLIETARQIARIGTDLLPAARAAVAARD
jgi:hypothetical protein